MRTTLNIDPELLDVACRVTGVNEECAVIELLPASLVAAGLGEAYPVASNDSSDGRG